MTLAPSRPQKSQRHWAESMAKLTAKVFPPKPAAERLTSFNAFDLMSMELDPVCYVVPGYIAEGRTILAGASKLGKSWLVLQAAMAVARGSTCLGGQCDQGDVLYPCTQGQSSAPKGAPAHAEPIGRYSASYNASVPSV